jgi:hypothetical protein
VIIENQCSNSRSCSRSSCYRSVGDIELKPAAFRMAGLLKPNRKRYAVNFASEFVGCSKLFEMGLRAPRIGCFLAPHDTRDERMGCSMSDSSVEPRMAWAEDRAIRRRRNLSANTSAETERCAMDFVRCSTLPTLFGSGTRTINPALRSSETRRTMGVNKTPGDGLPVQLSQKSQTPFRAESVHVAAYSALTVRLFPAICHSPVPNALGRNLISPN